MAIKRGIDKAVEVAVQEIQKLSDVRRRHPLCSRDYCSPSIRGKALMEPGWEKL
jgi:hypothetical protein